MPATASTGPATAGETLGPDQQVITVNAPNPTPSNPFGAHSAQVYGTWADQNPAAPGVSSLQHLLVTQANAGPVIRQGATTFEGPTVPMPTGSTPPGVYLLPTVTPSP